ncbi:hypothetical protein EEB18_002235 [Sphingopyxis sp. OPL5]|uniref:hypothetical protein n=1 Tax=Sphingopyxis sp. OPL5 TaxID=2486273 RepID=UPI00164E2046|nr:hypothetical protein [Sphingopyxis sp. OPL5]QNO27821.1 hypothetical protein EEB18_002235 [Sphingopyxis sp. OPL5]
MPDIGSETASVGASGSASIEYIECLAAYAGWAMSEPTNQHARIKSRTNVKT